MKDPRDPFLNHLLDDLTDERVEGPGEGDGMPPLTELQDRVVIMLLFNQRVQAEEVEHAWQRWRERVAGGEEVALWRVLAEDPATDREAIYEEAARLYSFEPVGELSRMSALALIANVRARADDEQVREMVRLGVVPVRVEEGQQGQRRLVFASNDPVRPEVLRLVEQLTGGTEYRGVLCYAPEGQLAPLIERAFSGVAGRHAADGLRESDVRPGASAASTRQAHEVRPQDTPAPAEEKPKGEAAPARKRQEVPRAELVELFEEALVVAVEERARHLVVTSTASRQVEILLRHDDYLARWHVEDRVEPEVFLTVIRERTRCTEGFGEEGAEVDTFFRWIDDERVRFRLQALPIATMDRTRVGQRLRITVMDDRRV